MHQDEIDLGHLRTWVGRRESRHDIVSPSTVQAMVATLDMDTKFDEGAALPFCWHWLFCHSPVRQSEIGPDGHPKRGGFLPPVPLPRRMWAGGRLAFEQPLRVGASITRDSEIADVTLKSGKTGHLVFVTVRHVIRSGEQVLLTEEQDIVYREPSRGDAPAPAPRPAPERADWRRTIFPDPVLLFRYSALTFNGHRIHYDRSYVTAVEGYSGLVVHGPLVATLLLDLLRSNRPDAIAKNFSFRGVAPLTDENPFDVQAALEAPGRATLWTRDAAGGMTMQAELVFAE
jgi:3-methylfumaryl-CoA hydratase